MAEGQKEYAGSYSGSNNFEFSSENSRIVAAQQGYEVRVAEGDEVFVDLDDSAPSLDRYNKWKHILPKGSSTAITASKTPGHYHVVVTLPYPHFMAERLLLAAILGGDLNHVAISYKRYQNDDPAPILFFEQPAPQQAAPISEFVPL